MMAGSRDFWRGFLLGAGAALLLAGFFLWVMGARATDDKVVVERARERGMVERKTEAKNSEGEKTEEETQSRREKEQKTDTVQSIAPAEVEVQIPAGTTSDGVADILVKAGIITEREALLNLLRQSGREGKIIAKTYRLRPGMNPQEVVDIITSGK
ncbi:MAG: YceG-like family [Eubacteriales bacterium]|nr:YceG-like family [Eubacteriales bacterium]MDN5364165.1 YceG-like family [Eubacteriales bacterium]